MRDEDFEYFISKFDEATFRQAVPQAAIEEWKDRLPQQLMDYWRTEGWCAYKNGLFWTVNPSDYEDLVDEWLEGTPLEDLDAFHVVARTAFGELHLCGEVSGTAVVINCATHAAFVLKQELRRKSPETLALEIRCMFTGANPSDMDLKAEDKQPLFERALRLLGPLEPDEMYGFEPALILGGRMRLENLARVKLDPHLTILRQFAPLRLPYSGNDFPKKLG